MDSSTNLRSEHVVDEPVLGDPGQALESRRADRRAPVMPVSADFGTSVWNPRLDPRFKLLRGYRHALKRSEMLSLY